MSQVNMMDALNTTAYSVERPKPRPPGTYQGVVVGAPKQLKRTVSGEEKDIISFLFKVVAPIQVDDQEALAEAGDMSGWSPMNHDIWLSEEQDLWKLKKFLVDVLGVDPGTEADAKTFSQMLAETPGRPAVLSLINKPYQDKATGNMEIATNIGSVAKL